LFEIRSEELGAHNLSRWSYEQAGDARRYIFPSSIKFSKKKKTAQIALHASFISRSMSSYQL
jgi:hypothetical protein